VDVLRRHQSGPALLRPKLAGPDRQRQLLIAGSAALDWPELTGCNLCRKPGVMAPMDGNAKFYGPAMENRKPAQVLRQPRASCTRLWAGSFVLHPAALHRMRHLLRILDPGERRARSENQGDGFLGEGLPEEGERLWRKAGWMSQARHVRRLCGD